MRVSIRRGDAEAIFDDVSASARQLPEIVATLLTAFPEVRDDPGVQIDTGGQVERADTWHDPGTSPSHPFGFQPSPSPWFAPREGGYRGVSTKPKPPPISPGCASTQKEIS